MRILPVSLMSLAMLVLPAACVSAPSREPMTLAQCAEARTCRIEGALRLLEVDHVMMGRLELSEGGCVNVSLPPREVSRIQAEGSQHYVAEGRVFPAPGDPNIVNLTIEGRRVGWHQCGDFYVFVD